MFIVFKKKVVILNYFSNKCCFTICRFFDNIATKSRYSSLFRNELKKYFQVFFCFIIILRIFAVIEMS